MNRYLDRAHRARRGMLLLAALAGGCGPSDGGEPAVRTVQHALTTANRLCADYEPYTPAERHCEDTADVARVHAAGAQRAGAVHIGSLRLWVDWPADEGQEADATKVTGWFVQGQRVLDYLKSTNANVGLVTRSLDAMQKEKEQLRASQERLLAAKKNAVDAVTGGIVSAVKAEVSEEKRPLVEELGRTRLVMAELQPILARAQRDMQALQPQYASTVTRFLALKQSEGATQTALAALATSAASADLQGIASAKQGLATLEHDEVSRCNAFQLETVRLRAQVSAVQESFERRLAPHADFMRQKGLRPEALVDSAARSLASMLTYCDERRARFLQATSRLREQLRLRTDGLVIQATDQATRDTLTQAALLEASKSFLEEANARIEELWRTPPRSTRLKLPYLLEQYDAFAAFLQLEPICTTPSAATWTEAGCIALTRHFQRARTYMTSTMALTMRFNVPALRRGGASAQLLQALEAALAANDTRGACVLHDAAVRSTEGGTP